MQTLDRTVHMPDEEAHEGQDQQPALAERAAVVARFREGSAAQGDCTSTRACARCRRRPTGW
ncbi:hypothetical protein [Streptomyces sp. NPDC101166]|uniref:hypothetical protein n=1 Tax=Streptomyces sp. NPDC101166 TaxID=3366120 RepID=UPI0038199616